MRRLLTIGALTALLAACSGDGTAGTESTIETPTTSTSPVESTTIAPPSTTLAPEPTTTLPEEPQPEGSGCTPGAGALPDGNWYGLVVDFTADGISFDLACWFSIPDATMAAAEDGQESPPPNDYYVRNHSDLLRELTVDGSVPVTWYPSGAPLDVAEGTFVEWTQHLAEEEIWFGVWVTITDGEVTEIEEMWVP